MQVRVIEQVGQRELEIQILCGSRTAAVEAIERRCRLLGGEVAGYPLGGSPERRRLALADIVLFELVAERVLIHLRDKTTLESPLRLFQIEEALAGTEFVRISRQALVNFDAVVAIRPEMNARLVLVLEDGRLVLVTRSHASSIRRKIGMGAGQDKRAGTDGDA